MLLSVFIYFHHSSFDSQIIFCTRTKSGNSTQNKKVSIANIGKNLYKCAMHSMEFFLACEKVCTLTLEALIFIFLHFQQANDCGRQNVAGFIAIVEFLEHALYLLCKYPLLVVVRQQNIPNTVHTKLLRSFVCISTVNICLYVIHRIISIYLPGMKRHILLMLEFYIFVFNARLVL